MHIKLAYGAETVPIDVPDNWINGRCYRPRIVEPCADPRAELMAALAALPENQSLAKVLEGKGTCAIAVDGDHPALCRELLPALLEILEDESELHRENFTIIVSNRLWQPLSKDDLNTLIDEETRKHYRVVLHDPFDTANITDLGESSRKIPLTINSLFKNADARIILGGVCPDMLLGFSGGRGVLMPGLAGKATLRAVYDFNMIADKNTKYGSFRDNPFHITGVETVNAAGCDLAVSAVLNNEDRILKVFAGHFGQSHLQAMMDARDPMMVRVKEQMDIVVTSGGGAPHDSTLLKIINTICAVAPVLKKDGTIVISAALDEGLGPKGFGELLLAHKSVYKTMEALSINRRFIPGQWIIQRLFSILQDHEVILFNKSLDEQLIWDIGLTPSRDLNEAILGAMESHGQRCKIVALPDGPLCLGEIGGK